MEKYETIEQLGEGAFAVVTKAKDTVTGSMVAIKKLKKKYQTWQECVDLREVKSLSILKKHENIIKLKEMIRVEDALHLVFEFMEKNLLELMIQKQTKKFTENQIRCVMWQTLQGLAYMHKYGFFHRDLKPENLLVAGEVIKIADFGLAREIRSLPPYTDYVSTRYYRAPECILKSTNYNSPVDIWALGCIMIEMYNLKPIFVGNTEKEVLFKMCSVLGTPTNTSWPEGVQMAKKIDLKFPTNAGTPLSQIIPDASKEALDLISEMLKWDPNKRSTASSLLQHPFFTNFPTPTRISTPEYNNSFNTAGKNVKSYSNVSHKKPHKQENGDGKDFKEYKEGRDKDLNANANKETDITKLLEDTKGFNEFIKKMKDQKLEEDKKYMETKDLTSPIVKKIDDEFDFDMPTYFKDNPSTLYSNNSILNASVSHITGLGNTYLGMSINPNNNQTQTTQMYNYNKNFFDTTTLKNINGNGSRDGSRGSRSGSGSYGSNEKDQIDINNTGDLFNGSRRRNVNSNTGLNEKAVNEKINETMPINENSYNQKKKELDFDNCNVYLKDNVNPETEVGRNQANSRKRSAYKFIESTLEKAQPTNAVSNTVKSTKDPLHDKMANNFKSLGQINSNNNNFNYKNSITSTTALNSNVNQNNANANFNSSTSEKKEFQSRRKNQMNNILNELDNPNVVDLNLKANFNNDNKSYNMRKNIAGSKEMMIGEASYNKKAGFNAANINENNFGIFNSRRHINNSNGGGITNTNSLNSNISKTQINKGGDNISKDKGKFLII